MWGFWTLCRDDNSIGTGHIRRCLTFAKYILEKKGNVCFIINNNQYAIELLRQNDIQFVLEENVENLPNSFFNFLFIDIYEGFEDESFIKEKLRLSELTIGITDYFEYVNLKCDISIYTNEAVKNVNLNNSQNHFFGAKYLIVENDFFLNKRDFNRELKNILITFGGYDPFNVTQQVLNSILQNPDRFEKYKFNILIGGMYPYLEELIESLEKSNLKFEMHRNVDDIASFYADNDFVITAGGNTFYEVSIMGIPSLVISQNDRQHNAMNTLQSSLKMGYIGLYKNILAETTIGNELYQLINCSERLKNNSKCCLNFFKTDGKEILYLKAKGYEKQVNKRE